MPARRTARPRPFVSSWLVQRAARIIDGLASVSAGTVTTVEGGLLEPAATDLFAPSPPAASPGRPPAHELATAGEVAYLCKLMASKKIGIKAAREQAGLAAGETLDGLTKTEFSLMKEALA